MPAKQGTPRLATLTAAAGFAAALALIALLLTPGPTQARHVVAPRIETTIVDGPAEGAAAEDAQPTFSFEATRDGAPFPGAGFQCSVDGGPVQPCATPLRLQPLAAGEHSFSVFAEDHEHLSVDPSPATRDFTVVSAAEEEEEEEEECEAFEEEAGPGEEAETCEGEAGVDGAQPPEECLLRSARARLLSSAAQSRVKLLVRYTTFAPADAYVDYKLSGGRGTLKFAAVHEHLAETGAFTLSRRLDEAEMEKVRAARRVTVFLDVAEAPRDCRSYETRHLTIRRSLHSQVAWLQSESIFGTSA